MSKNKRFSSKISVNICNSTIILISGELSKFKGDAIVNSTSTSLDLAGSISKAFLKVGGQRIKTECQKKYPNGINHNQVAKTSAGENSNITSIYHIALPKCQKDSHEDIAAIENAITMSLEQFQTDNYTTIGIPTIGCGGLGYSEADVASGTFNAIQNFLNEYKNYSSKIVIIVSSDNEKRYKIFENEFENFKHQTYIEDRSVQSKLVLLKTDIFAIRADAFVNTTSTNLDLTGGISKALLKQGGKSIESECHKKYPKGISNSNVAVTSTGNIRNYKRLYHIALPSYQNNSNSDIKAVEDAVDICLDQLVNDGYSTIVFPTIGCGGLKYPADVVATGMLNSFERFYINNHDQKYKITVVVAPNEDKKYKEFEKIFERFKYDKYNAFSSEDSEESDSDNDSTCLKHSSAFSKKNRFRLKSRSNSSTSLHTTYTLKDKCPSHWENMDDNYEFQLFRCSGQEYTDICNDFITKLANRCKPKNIKIDRIQNPSLYLRYELFKEQLGKSGSQNEMTLYHGTKYTQHRIDNICRGGLKRNFTGKTGNFGTGVYFAVNSSLSHGYTDQMGKCYMFVAKVAVGSHTLGDRSMNHPPMNPVTKKEFNSTCNNDQTIFAIFDDSQSYPEYLITYEA